MQYIALQVSPIGSISYVQQYIVGYEFCDVSWTIRDYNNSWLTEEIIFLLSLMQDACASSSSFCVGTARLEHWLLILRNRISLVVYASKLTDMRFLWSEWKNLK